MSEMNNMVKIALANVFSVCLVVAVAAAVCFVLMAAAIFFGTVAWPWRALLWPLGVWGVATVAAVSDIALEMIRGEP